jgi:hypothetical protein
MITSTLHPHLSSPPSFFSVLRNFSEPGIGSIRSKKNASEKTQLGKAALEWGVWHEEMTMPRITVVVVGNEVRYDMIVL